MYITPYPYCCSAQILAGFGKFGVSKNICMENFIKNSRNSINNYACPFDEENFKLQLKYLINPSGSVNTVSKTIYSIISKQQNDNRALEWLTSVGFSVALQNKGSYGNDLFHLIADSKDLDESLKNVPHTVRNMILTNPSFKGFKNEKG